MFNKSRFILLLIIITCLQAFAQTGGESVYQFLNISTSARQVALGGEVLTINDDVNQAIWNPAAINDNIDNQLGANYLNYFTGINIGSLSFAHMINRNFGAIHGAVQYLDYGELIEADEEGTITGTFQARDLSFSVGYAYRFNNSDFYLGGNAKFINSSIAGYTSSGIAADIALMYHSLYHRFRFAVVARNLGVQIKPFIDTKEDLPLKLAVGFSHQPERVPIRWHLTLDNLQQWNLAYSNPSKATIDLDGNITLEKINFFKNTMRHVIIGAELFPEGFLSLRIGYNFKRANELKLENARTFPGVSMGFGMRMGKIKFSYAYSKLHVAAKTNTFSLLIDFNK